MDEKRRIRYFDKLSSLKKYFILLKKWFNDPNLEETIKNKNYERIFAIYHSAQLTVEVIIDISAMIVKDLELNPKDNYSNYETLFQNDIISLEIKTSLKELNGLRNRLAHDYNGIIDEIAYETLSKNIEKITKFKDSVELWLEKQ